MSKCIWRPLWNHLLSAAAFCLTECAALPGCEAAHLRHRGWATHGAMRPHLDNHAGGTLEGAVPADYLAGRSLQQCLVCGLLVSPRYNGVHPRCRPTCQGEGVGRDGKGALRCSRPTRSRSGMSKGGPQRMGAVPCASALCGGCRELRLSLGPAPDASQSRPPTSPAWRGFLAGTSCPRNLAAMPALG